MTEGHFTILMGPPRSGKTTYTRSLREDPEVRDFVLFEGHNEPATINGILTCLAQGKDVIYETTHDLTKVDPFLLVLVDTIEIFKRNPQYPNKEK